MQLLEEAIIKCGVPGCNDPDNILSALSASQPGSDTMDTRHISYLASNGQHESNTPKRLKCSTTNITAWVVWET